MLTYNPTRGVWRKEAAMSNVRVIPAAGQGGKGGEWEEGRPVDPQQTDTPEQADQDMMYAWSIGAIGVTSAARELVEQSAKAEETCPPEVYIG